VLQDEEARHQACRQRRLASTRRAHRAEAPVEELPVDLLRQKHQRMLQVDDLMDGIATIKAIRRFRGRRDCLPKVVTNAAHGTEGERSWTE
jgi:hypothetical protein